MRIDIDRNIIEFGEKRTQSTSTVVRLIALLESRRRLGLTSIAAGELIARLKPGYRQPRVFLMRLARSTQKAFEAVGENSPIISTGKSTGYWEILSSFETIEILGNGQLLSASAAQEFAGELGALPATRFSVALDLMPFRKMIEGDKAFASGRLQDALSIYRKVHKEAQTHLTQAIALDRLVSTLRRLEKFEEMRRFARKMRSMASYLDDSDVSSYCEVAADIALAWYDYAFDARYDLAWEKISNLGPRCRRFTNLHIDWLNLRGLVLRRQALNSIGDERRALAEESIIELKTAFFDAILLKQHYQIQQTASNLSNIMSLFVEKGDISYDNDSDSVVDMISLMNISEHIKSEFGIGYDDIYNAIYILSISRKHSIPFNRLVNIFERSDLYKSLSHFGDSAYVGESTPNEVGLTQKIQLSFEICYSSIAERDKVLFKKHCEEIETHLIALDDKTPHWVSEAVLQIEAILKSCFPNDKDWAELFERISYWK